MMSFKKKIKAMAGIIKYSLGLIVIASQTFSASSIDREICSADYIVCIDGGGSKTSLQVISSQMEVIALEDHETSTQSLSTGSTNINVVGFTETKSTLKDLLGRIKVGPEKRELKDIKNKSIICGLAGLSFNMDKDPLIRRIFTSFGFQDPHIALDSDIGIAKHLLGEQGAILIAGTGSICFSKVSGKEKHTGGYGYALDDGGSGFYFGKLALVAACEHMDQQKEPFILTEQLCSHFKVPSIKDVIKLFYDGTIKPLDIAKTAPLVFEAAFKQNNKECQSIVDQGATELAKLIKVAVENSNQPDFPIYLIGGVFKDKNVDCFIEMIQKKVPYSHGLKFVNIAHDNIAVHVIQRNLSKDQGVKS